MSAVITGQFYNGEEPVYPAYGVDSPDMSNFQNWGHFSQVVWQGTESVGCYSYTCNPTNDCQPNGQPYLANTPCGPGGVPAINHVCNYYPPGEFPRITQLTRCHEQVILTQYMQATMLASTAKSAPLRAILELWSMQTVSAVFLEPCVHESSGARLFFEHVGD